MHEDDIRDRAAVKAFEIIMRQMINASGRDNTSLQLRVLLLQNKREKSRRRMNGDNMAALEQQRYLYSSVYVKLLLPLQKPENSSGVLNCGLMKKSPASSYLLVCRRSPVCRNKHFICAPHVPPTRA